MPNDAIGVLPEIDFESLEFFERLSSGSYGTVYRAKWKTNDSIVAVKRLLVLEKEAHILGLLRHRNIIQFFGAVTKSPNFCIITEFASNGSLYDYLQDKTNPDLSFDGIVQWAVDIASGVQYLHFDAPVPIIHRDLKSKNVVISSANVCKLCDFGTSKPLAHTTRMTYVGTMPWMSPEMIQSQPVSAASDTWSYGVILWELITREIPFDKLHEYRIAWMVAEKGVRLTVPQSCPSPLSDFLRRCWETEPKARPDFKEILRVLDAMRSDGSTSTRAGDFLGKKNEWTLEIQAEMTRLKEKESVLIDKDLKLRDWEHRLRGREQNLENRRRELPAHDINVWTDEDVATWLIQLNTSGFAYQQLSDLAETFRRQQITGERLLLLTDTDLTNLGLGSPALRWQLIREIKRLDYDNRRMINFPPLSIQEPNQTPTNARARRTSSPVAATQQRPVDLTLLFCIYVRLGPSLDSHKWKILMDIDDNNDVLVDHPVISEVSQLIADVSFVLPTPPYVYKVKRHPYATREWIVGLNGSTRVQCVVNFTDNVRQPRNTNFTFDVDYESRGLTIEKRVQLYLRSLSLVSSPRARAGFSRNASLTPGAANGGGGLHESQSSPTLARAWQERSFADAVPVISPPPQPTNARSPLWAEIASGLRTKHPSITASEPDRSMEKRPSVPTVGLDKSIQLNTRAVSYDPQLPTSTRTGIGFHGGDSTTPTPDQMPSPIPKRQGGRRRYSRNFSAQRSAGGSTELSESSSNSLFDLLQSTPEDTTSQEGETVKPQGPDASSATSFQVHGGYQKWKWKHENSSAMQ